MLCSDSYPEPDFQIGLVDRLVLSSHRLQERKGTFDFAFLLGFDSCLDLFFAEFLLLPVLFFEEGDFNRFEVVFTVGVVVEQIEIDTAISFIA